MTEQFVPAPHINFDKVPPKERDAAHSVQSGALDLTNYVEQFGAALNLFDFCASQEFHINNQPRPLLPQHIRFLETSRGWAHMAGRQGAMAIYHFGVACDGIREALTECDTVRNAMDYNAFKQARRAFRKAFPDSENVRHAVAHVADKIKTPAKVREHGFTGSHNIGTGLVISDSTLNTFTDIIVGRTITNSWSGKLYSYELSTQTRDTLEQIKHAVWLAFRPPAPSVPVARRP